MVNMNILNKAKERDLTLDVVKGVGIIAVVIGHLTLSGRQFIFSFHMPLFFIISGFLFSVKPLNKSLLSDFKRLIIPYLITCGIIVLAYVLYGMYSHKPLWQRWLIASAWGSGAIHTAPYFGRLPHIGAIWFLLALFWCKSLFLILVSKINSIVVLGAMCLIISLISGGGRRLLH